MKFKKGDTVILIENIGGYKQGQEGIIEYFVANMAIIEIAQPSHRVPVEQNAIELKNVYNSPLYQALL